MKRRISSQIEQFPLIVSGILFNGLLPCQGDGVSYLYKVQQHFNMDPVAVLAQVTFQMNSEVLGVISFLTSEVL